MPTCDNCGEKVYSGRCVNCHEELYILDQYDELELPPPDEHSEFMERAREQQREVSRNAYKNMYREACDENNEWGNRGI